jgi:parvulin-like peptidyl-prolyl isomerase
MKQITILSLLLFILVQCSDDRLKKGTPLYTLAKELAQKVPEIDPDSNKIWISTDAFDIRPSEILPVLQGRFGNRLDTLRKSSPLLARELLLNLGRMIARNRILVEAAHEQNIYYSQAKFDSMMQIQINKWGGLERLKQNLEKDGMNIEEVQEAIKEGLTIEQYMKRIIPDSVLAVTDKDIMLFYNNFTVTVRYITLSISGKSEDEKIQIHQKMEDILKQARSGVDFAQLAMTYSEDQQTKGNGGFYVFSPGRTVPEFEQVAFNLPIGEISDVFETFFGYYILTVINREPDKEPLEKVRAKYIRGLKQVKLQRSRIAQIEFLKSQVHYKEYIG